MMRYWVNTTLSFLIMVFFINEMIFPEIPGDKDYRDGITAFAKDDYQTAIEKFKAAYEQDPNNSTYISGLANSYFFVEKYNLAIKYYEKYIKIVKNDSKAYYYLGLSYYNIKNYKKSRKYFAKVSKNSEYYKDAQIHLGNAYYYEGGTDNLRKAKILFAELTKKFPTEPKVFYGYGCVFFKDKMYKEAITNLSKARDLGGLDPDIYLKLADSYAILNQKDNAIENYELFLALSTDNDLKKEARIKLEKLKK